MQLGPLQSRLAASLAASLLVLALYLLLFAPSTALASDVDRVYQTDLVASTESSSVHAGLQDVYEPDFNLFDRSIIGRAPAGVTPLNNNEAKPLNLPPGTSACFMVEKSIIFSGNDGNTGQQTSSSKRAVATGGTNNEGPPSSSRTVYISANTCLQPHRVSPDAKGSDVPQLTIYVSASSNGGCVDASHRPPGIQTKIFDQGAVTYSVNATDDVFISVMAPNVTTDFEGLYNFEVAASTDDYYHQYNDNGAELLWMDSDSSSALLMTKNFTTDYANASAILQEEPPYELYIENKNYPTLTGLFRSACGLNVAAQIASKRLDNGQLNNNNMVRTKMTTKGQGNLPKQQFYFEGLNSSSSYTGVLVKPANITNKAKRQNGGLIGGGGVVFASTDFQTSSGTNCNLITDLEFCTDVQWAVPGNNKLNNSALAKVYDDYAKGMYSYFEKVIMQIPCEAPPTQQYSLATNCDECKVAYKQWLCAVTIPRCEDFSTDNGFTITRNAGQAFPNGTLLPDNIRQGLVNIPASNASRNSFIDEVIAPGPYKEILPCEDICYKVVQSCPAILGFGCPQPSHIGFNTSYGRRGKQGEIVTCNYPGIPRTKTGAAGKSSPDNFVLFGFLGLALAMLV